MLNADIDIYIIKDINVFKSIRNYLVTSRRVSNNVQNEPRSLANISIHHQHVVEMRKRHNIVDLHCWHVFL